MKLPEYSKGARCLLVWAGLLVLAVQLFSNQAVATQDSYTLHNGNSSLTISPKSDWGMDSWIVDCTDQLYRQWSWYRIGNAAKERPINSLSLLCAQQTLSGNGLMLQYGNSQLSVEVLFYLSGGGMGSGSSEIFETITIGNVSSQPLDLHFFQYADFDLAGSGPGDTLQLLRDSEGLFVEALQKKGNILISDTFVDPGANHGQVGTLDSIYNSLANSSATTLNDSTGPIFGDTEWAFQWDRTLAPCDTFTIGVFKTLSPAVPIPEPTTASLATIGLIGFGLLRRFVRVKERYSSPS